MGELPVESFMVILDHENNVSALVWFGDASLAFVELVICVQLSPFGGNVRADMFEELYSAVSGEW